jgi:hypothetical protein
MFQKKCQTCQLYVPQARTCQIMIPQMQGKIGPEDYCSQHNDHLLTCEVCGAGLLEPLIELIDGTVHVYCGNCINHPRQ